MFINRKSLLSLIILLMLTAPGVLFAQGRPRPMMHGVSYFPLRVGNHWLYEKKGVGAATSWKVTVDEQTSIERGQPAFTLSGYFPGPSRHVRAGNFGLVTEENPESFRDFIWYVLGAPVGYSWQLQLGPTPWVGPGADCINNAKLVIASRDEVVKVPAGEFSDVVRIDFSSRCNDAGIISEWFAPGVGLIRRQEDSIAGPVTSELVEADLADGALPRVAYSTTLSLDKPRYVNNLMPPVDVKNLAQVSGLMTVRNATSEPIELAFSGCKSVSIVVRDQAGDTVLKTRGDDGGCCTCKNLLIVKLEHSAVVLPVSLRLIGDGSTPLPDGRYVITATLDTTDPQPLRPSASAVVVVDSVH